MVISAIGLLNQLKHLRPHDQGGEHTIFNLFTKSNPTEYSRQYALTEENLSSFNQSIPSVFVLHGINSKDESGALHSIVESFLDPDFKDEDYNVFYMLTGVIMVTIPITQEPVMMYRRGLWKLLGLRPDHQSKWM